MKLILLLATVALAAGSACNNTADSGVLHAHASDFHADLKGCATSAWGDAKKTATCLAAKIGLSAKCAQCFGDDVHCSATKCAAQCTLSPDSAACLKCSTDKCQGALVTCSGIPAGSLPHATAPTATPTTDASAHMPEVLTRRQVEFLFEAWRIEFGVTFASAAEYIKRMDVFADNHWAISKHNALGLDWTMAHNEFSHLTWEEFRASKLGFGKVPQVSYAKVNAFADAEVSTLATEVDWTTKGAVTPVKNQGQCGSCWSFSTTGGLEGAYAIKTGNLKSFSEEQLVDCDHTDSGCQGGLMDNAFAWIKKNGGICLERDYPYTSGGGTAGQCQRSCSIVPGTASGHRDIAQSEAALQAALSQQPVSIAIEADQSGFQFYSSGVFSGSCGTQLDHGVLAVGFGVENGQKYWKVKNSWGATWGSAGYIKFQKGKAQRGGQCGILLSASIAVL